MSQHQILDTWHRAYVQETNWDAQREKACVNTYPHASASQICLQMPTNLLHHGP